jgi:hypothetical protein
MIDFILKEYLEKKDEMSSQDIPQIHRRVQK